MSKKVIFDLDDTLLNLRKPMMDALNYETGKSIHYLDWLSYGLDDIYGITRTDFVDIGAKHSILEKSTPHDGATTLLNTLRGHGYEIIFLTARGWHPDSRNITSKWLAEHDYVYDDLIICEPHEKKIDCIEHINDVKFVVDDNVEHCVGFQESGKFEYVLLFDQPWNKNYNMHMIDERIHLLSQLHPEVLKEYEIFI